jgi:hypothetical protein
VDDFAIAATHQELIDDLCATLRVRYQITESDNLESFLGIHILKDKDTLYLSQPGHIAKIIATADIGHISKVTNIPMDPTFNDVHQDDSPRCDQHKYSGLLGMLIYVLRTRPDISYAVNRLATRSTKSNERDWQALQQVAAYLCTTSHYKLVYNTTEGQHEVDGLGVHRGGICIANRLPFQVAESDEARLALGDAPHCIFLCLQIHLALKDLAALGDL